jgi:hypothetical protein
MGLIKDMDINKDSLIIYHGLNNPEAIKKLSCMFVELLSLNGHAYDSTISEKLIVLKRLPEAGKILMRMAEGFKTKEESLASYYADLQKMLDMLKNVPSNEEFVKSLGGKFGKKIIQKYEKDKKIERWNATVFVSYVQEIGAIFKAESKWTKISENVIHGKIITCPLVKDEGKLNITNCTFIKGIFDEWALHAFGEGTERVHTLAHENNCCEIYIAFEL